MRVLAITLLLAIAACGGEAALLTVEEAPAADEEMRGSIGAVSDTDALETTAVDIAITAGRQVIRQARIELRSEDTRISYDRIVSLVEGRGGFVAHAEVAPVQGEDEHPAIFLVVRVPAADLTNIMSAIKATADEVVSESQGTQDVTAQFIDLEARLVNLQALETELRALLEEVRNQPGADPEKLLRVFAELSTVRGEIELLAGQLAYLEEAVELATIELAITPSPAAVPIVEEPWNPAEVARDALRRLVSGLQAVAGGVITFVVYLLPVLALTVGVPGAAGYWGYRRWRGRRPPGNVTV